MPEGDTVWLSARQLHDALAGRVLRRSDFRVPRLATTDLTGRAVREVLPRGKHILTRVDGDVTIHTHFAMDGAWGIYAPQEKWRGGPGHHIRLVLANDSATAVGYRLPIVELLRTADERRAVGHLGPDVLGADWDEHEVVRRLLSQPDREIGPALLDQRNLAGIGNLYKAETLFLCGVSPWTRVREIGDVTSVVRRARELITANREIWAQPTTGQRERDEHWVFDRAGQPCRRCGSRIRLAMQNEAAQPTHERITYWCPSCQHGHGAGGEP